MLLSYVDISAASLRAPEAILEFFGPGGEEKSLLLCDLMGSVWGSGHIVPPPSLLQTPEEFRRQCHLYRGLKRVDIVRRRDPHSRHRGGIFKLFVSGGSLCLGENHEPETQFADWPRCGKVGP